MKTENQHGDTSQKTQNVRSIEEAAIIAAANYDNPFDEPAYDKKFYDGFLAGANHIMSLPLSYRLTDEEKRSVRDIYMEAKGQIYGSAYMRGRFRALQDVFGKEMFE